MIPFAWAVLVACRSPAEAPTRSPALAELPVEEIEGPVEPPGPRVVDAAGKPQLGATPEELRGAGDYYYRTGELTLARELYAACSGGADGQLRSACQWAVGATLVAEARRQAKADRERERGLGLQPRPSECTPASQSLHFALSLLRVAHRGQPTDRRAQVIAALEQELGSSSECRPSDCPNLPYGWHRRSGEHEVHGSGLEGSSREHVFACFGEPLDSSRDTWTYAQTSCDSSSNQSVETTVRIHFADDIVDRVTHERTVKTGRCVLQAN